ncbi:uncharacterized protein LOC131153473 [Malania oleifera]|uniref:uncharacterized protein LOC131153473 n=1 Tax=Malania oleifera TaxID=397392 RepID=UPI0025AE30D8|nr:uncharacterized protein LOC131153473 [Malania oleifera]XP_057961798.1 uncharacterized protein LOC131153473 [Malania oleifera]
MPLFLTETSREGREGGQNISYRLKKAVSPASSVREIEEEEGESDCSSELFEIGEDHGRTASSWREDREFEESLFSFDIGKHYSRVDVEGGGDGDDRGVYVAVGKSDTSAGALVWALKHAVSPRSRTSAVVYLLHVFPHIRHIPSPLGKLPISQVDPQQVQQYMTQESDKRKEFLQPFIDVCSAFKVKAETILIEDDKVAKAILNHIPTLNIRQLVVGAKTSKLRKLKSRRGSGKASQILRKAPDSCEVIVICDGKQVVFDHITEMPSPRSSDASTSSSRSQQDEEGHHRHSFSINSIFSKVKRHLRG